MLHFLHGTSDCFLSDIEQWGLLPPMHTGNKTEKRHDLLDVVLLTPATEDGRRAAEGYGIRAALKFGGKPIILEIALPESAVYLERQGRIEQWCANEVPPENITGVYAVEREPSIEAMVDVFSRFKHQKRMYR